MRRTITVAAAALLALPLAACGDDGGSTGTGTGSGDAAKPIIFGIPSPLATEPGEHNINLGITCYADKIGGKVITLDSNLDVNKQISDFDNLLAQGANVLPFLPLDPKAFTAPFERAKEAGAIVVELYNPNSTAPGSVYEDSPAAGEDAVTYVTEKLPDGAKALVIGGPPIPAVTERIAGFKDNAAAGEDHDPRAGGQPEGQRQRRPDARRRPAHQAPRRERHLRLQRQLGDRRRSGRQGPQPVRT